MNWRNAGPMTEQVRGVRRVRWIRDRPESGQFHDDIYINGYITCSGS